MSFNPKEVGLVLLLVFLVGGMTRYCTPEKIRYSTGEMQQNLDSLTALSRSLYLTKDQLQDSLKETSKSFQDYIKKTNDEIASYSRISGELRLVVDSLKSVTDGASLVDLVNTDTTNTNKFRDTTLVSSSTWAGDLLVAEARGGIRNDSLYLDPPVITQQRLIRIDVATTFSKDYDNVNTIVTSKDFKDLQVESFTPLEKKKKFPWTQIVAVVTFLLGYAL